MQGFLIWIRLGHCSPRKQVSAYLHSPLQRILNPFGPLWFFESFGSTLRDAGRFEEAVLGFKKAIQSAPDNLSAHLGLAATYSMMDREKEARAEATEVLRVYPKFSLDNWASARSFYRNQSVIYRVTGALRKAGLK